MKRIGSPTISTKHAIRVCHVSTVHHCEDVRIVERECGTLAQRGYHVHLVIPDAKSEGMVGAIRFHTLRRIKFRPFRIPVAPWIAMFTALRTNADIYHLHDPELLPVGFFMRWMLRRRVVYDVHEAVAKQILGKEWIPRWCQSFMALLYKLAERFLARGLALILANENCIEDYLYRRNYLVRNFPLVLEGEMSHCADKGDGNKRKPELLVYVGGVSRDRGGDLYLELARRLLDKGRSFELQVVGPCHPKYKAQLEKKIETNGLQDVVRLAGRLPHQDALSLVSQASIGLCLLFPIPNYTTCLATKILEYMMCGTAVLASNFAAWRPYVEGEGSGLMADPNDIESVVSACERMLNDPQELQAMAQRGRKAVVERLNWETEFKVLEQCYRDLLR